MLVSIGTMSLAAERHQWSPDSLGLGFTATTLPLGVDPDGEGEVVATVVKHDRTTKVPEDSSGDGNQQATTAYLWVHGFSDYFFHHHVAEHFNSVDFYGVDLRKCGRSRREDQHWHYVSDLSYYFEDLYAVMNLLSDYQQVVIMAHSTGGLVVPLWLDDARRHHPEIHRKISGLVLNSPWLDMMFPSWLVTVFRPVVKVLGKRFPLVELGHGKQTTYVESLRQWDFNRTFKPLTGHRKYLGWARAVILGQERVHQSQVDVGVPVLALCSDRCLLRQPWSPEADHADVILDVDQIQDRAPLLGQDVSMVVLSGARHDVFLSEDEARNQAFSVTERWLAEHTLH